MFVFAAIAYSVCREPIKASLNPTPSTNDDNSDLTTTCTAEICSQGRPDECTAKSTHRVRGRKKKFKKCQKCAPVLFLSHIPQTVRDHDDRYSFISLKELVKNELCWPTQTCISMFWFIYSYFHAHRRWLLVHSTNVNANFKKLKMRILGIVNDNFKEVPDCHKMKLINKFVTFLARRYAKDLTRYQRHVHKDHLKKSAEESKTEYRRVHVT